MQGIVEYSVRGMSMSGRSVRSFPEQHALEIRELAGVYRLGVPVAEYRGGFTERETKVIGYVGGYSQSLSAADSDQIGARKVVRYASLAERSKRQTVLWKLSKKRGASNIVI